MPREESKEMLKNLFVFEMDRKLKPDPIKSPEEIASFPNSTSSKVNSKVTRSIDYKFKGKYTRTPLPSITGRKSP